MRRSMPPPLRQTSIYLVSVWDVERAAGVGDVSDDAAAPRHSPLVRVAVVDRRVGADVEQLADETSILLAAAAVSTSFHEEQRTPACKRTPLRNRPHHCTGTHSRAMWRFGAVVAPLVARTKLHYVELG